MSRELDAEVAEKVMGHQINWMMNALGHNTPFLSGCPDGEVTTAHYSTSIADAWLVVEKMQELGWCWNIESHLENQEIHMKLWNGDDLIGGEWCKTAPEAICRAALAAVEGR